MEGDEGTAVRAVAYDLYRSKGFTLAVLLYVDLALTVNLSDEKVTECVNAGYTYAVQTAGYLVAVLIELTAGVQHCKNYLQCGAMLLGVHTGRNTTTVILDGNGIVLVDIYGDVGAEAGHGFVDTVIYDLIYQVMQTSFAYISDVHGRSFSYRLKSFQDLDTAGRIFLLRSFDFFCL
jgi:hypothetical protein